MSGQLPIFHITSKYSDLETTLHVFESLFNYFYPKPKVWSACTRQHILCEFQEGRKSKRTCVISRCFLLLSLCCIDELSTAKCWVESNTQGRT